jgi:hypothetical protein
MPALPVVHLQSSAFLRQTTNFTLFQPSAFYYDNPN